MGGGQPGWSKYTFKKVKHESHANVDDRISKTGGTIRTVTLSAEHLRNWAFIGISDRRGESRRSDTELINLQQSNKPHSLRGSPFLLDTDLHVHPESGPLISSQQRSQSIPWGIK